MAGEYPTHTRTVMFSASTNRVQIHATLHGPGIIMLQPEVIIVDKCRNDGPQKLITVFLRIQNAIRKMPLGSMSITKAC